MLLMYQAIGSEQSSARPQHAPFPARVIVAVDGGPSALTAVTWAASESARLRRPMTLVSAYGDRSPLRTMEQALRSQRQLRKAALGQRPWSENVRQIVRRGSLADLLRDTVRSGDIVVLSADGDARTRHELRLQGCTVFSAARPDRPQER